MRGKISDTNLALVGALDEGAWSAELPLANVLVDGYLARPARCEDPTNPAATRLRLTLPSVQTVNLVAVLFHTLSYSARYRLTVADYTGSFAAPLYQTPWTEVYPRIWSSADLRWEAANWWTGQALESDIALRPRHLWISLPDDLIAKAIRLEFDDAGSEAEYLDIGGLWVADGLTPAFNFERGRQLGASSRDLVDEADSGRLFGSRRFPRRKLGAQWAMLSDQEAYRFADMAVRLGTIAPVLFVPDAADQASLFREAFPATFEQPPDPTFVFDGLNTCTATFKELLA